MVIMRFYIKIPCIPEHLSKIITPRRQLTFAILSWDSLGYIL